VNETHERTETRSIQELNSSAATGTTVDGSAEVLRQVIRWLVEVATTAPTSVPKDD
jgi:hypothetical protein